MKYVLKDGCNNISSCEIIVIVEDGIVFILVCFEGVFIILMQGGMNEFFVFVIEIGSSYDNCIDYENFELCFGFELGLG